MKKIGITGGIGSGKTTVCEIFKLLGIPVFHADQEAKNLQNNDPKIRDLIIELLGKDVYTKDGILDRKKVAEIVFNNKKALSAINKIIHPAVRQQFIQWSDRFPSAPYILYEAAILFESGYASDFDKNILILADEMTRITRVIKRDHTTVKNVRQRISNQLNDDQKIQMADYLIENNNDKLVIPQILRIDKIIREYGKIW